MAENQGFDPTRVLDGWRAPEGRSADVSPDLHLDLRLDPGAGTAPELDDERLARLRRRGYDMREVVDVEPRMHLSLAGGASGSGSAPDVADVTDPVDAAGGPASPGEPDGADGHPRVLTQWQPRAWMALCRRVCGPRVEIVQTPEGPVVDHHDPQWLCAVWPPQRIDAPLLGRWPEALVLMPAPSEGQALVQLLTRLPAQAQLWHADLEADWPLLVELLLHQQPGLRGSQIEQLRALQQAERDRAFERFNQGYGMRDGLVWRHS